MSFLGASVVKTDRWFEAEAMNYEICGPGD